MQDMTAASARRDLWHSSALVSRWLSRRHLRSLRRRMHAVPPRTSGVERVFGVELRICDPIEYYIQYKDQFVRRIYAFESAKPDPLIVDGGSHIGMSIVFFRLLYPQCRIIGFEPDPEIFGVLQENVERNGIRGVTVHNVALGRESGSVGFRSSRDMGSHVESTADCVQTVRAVRLSEFLNEPVDMLKLNIEGEELPVLEELAIAGKLATVDQMVVEYHGWPGKDDRLGLMLTLLSENGFRCMVHDFDSETGGASKPPFRLSAETEWCCLVYARRRA